jgi:hypothetical protein
MNRRNSLAALLGLGLGGVLTFRPKAVRAADEATKKLQVTGTPLIGGTFKGVFALQSIVQNFEDSGVPATFPLVAIGVLKGDLKGVPGLLQNHVEQIIALPVSTLQSVVPQAAAAAVAAAACPILHLELGPLDLNVLGLVIHLNRIVLDITAQSGQGNLLGNLLCAVANLLNGGLPTLQGLLNQLIGVLNQILAAL